MHNKQANTEALVLAILVLIVVSGILMHSINDGAAFSQRVIDALFYVYNATKGQ